MKFLFFLNNPLSRHTQLVKKPLYLKLFVLLVIVCGMLSSCSSLKRKRKQYCKNLDIYKLAYNEALEGEANRFNFHNQKCLEYKVQLNKDRYKAGWEAGLKLFCVKDYAYQHGVKGKSYNKTCPKDKEPAFLISYKKGVSLCFVNSGENKALSGKKSDFANSLCPKLEGILSESKYNKGYKVGLKKFCVYQKGYELGKGNRYRYQDQKICPQKLEPKFLAGYKKGIKECFYNEGYQHAIKGRLKNFNERACLPLKALLGKPAYHKGYNAGLVSFCSYARGYQFGLNGNFYQNTCPKKLEEDFFKGYILGQQEYNREQARQEALALERIRIENERRAREQALSLEQARIENENRAREESLAIKRDQAETNRRAFDLQKESFRLQKIKSYGYRVCKYNSDCHKREYCSYKSSVGEKVCKKSYR